MSTKPRYTCRVGCGRTIRGGSHCCNLCLRTNGARHGVLCPGTPPTGGPAGGPPKKS